VIEAVVDEDGREKKKIKRRKKKQKTLEALNEDLKS
jgi:hypothetical protein